MSERIRQLTDALSTAAEAGDVSRIKASVESMSEDERKGVEVLAAERATAWRGKRCKVNVFLGVSLPQYVKSVGPFDSATAAEEWCKQEDIPLQPGDELWATVVPGFPD